MQNPDSRRILSLGLIGGLLGALIVTSMPAVMAAVGDPITVGEVSKGNRTTTLRSADVPVLRLIGGGNGPALELKVGQGNRPFTIDSNKRIPKLNADRLDNRNADQLLRVAFDYSGDPISVNGPQAETEITAPTDGYLVMSGSMEVTGATKDEVQCFLGIHRGVKTNFYGHHDVTVHDPGGEHTSNGAAVCTTDYVLAVPAGTYEVSLRIELLATATLDNAAVWAMFVPFDGDGNPPVDPTW